MRDIEILKKKHDIAHIAAVERAERAAELATEQAELDGNLENKLGIVVQIPEKKPFVMPVPSYIIIKNLKKQQKLSLIFFQQSY